MYIIPCVLSEDLPAPIANTGTADFAAADKLKRPLLAKAAKKLLSDKKFAELRFQMEQFKEDNPWVLESALFDCLKREVAREKLMWWDWEAKVRDRHASTLKALKEKHADDIEIFIAVQLLFDRQWKSLKVREPVPYCIHQCLRSRLSSRLTLYASGSHIPALFRSCWRAHTPDHHVCLSLLCSGCCD